MNKPKVTCLCGSTKFIDTFLEQGFKLTLDGVIVLSVGVSKHGPADHAGEAMGPEVCAALDELHLRKIDLADNIMVLNVDGYVGNSTRNEVRYAMKTGKPVVWLEPDKIPVDLKPKLSIEFLVEWSGENDVGLFSGSEIVTVTFDSGDDPDYDTAEDYWKESFKKLLTECYYGATVTL